VIVERLNNFLFKKSKLRIKILKKIRKFNWIKMNIFCSLDFFFKSCSFRDKKMSKLGKWLPLWFFFSRIIQSANKKQKYSINLKLDNKNFILFCTVIDSKNVIIIKVRPRRATALTERVCIYEFVRVLFSAFLSYSFNPLCL